MPSKLVHLLSPFPPLLFAILAFAFTVVTITSRDWSRQYHYNSSEPEQWGSPLYTLYRSPFQYCTLDESSNATNKVTCSVFDAAGRGKTSCETLFVTHSADAAQTGDARLCQQIHRAGDLAITATTFISLGFVCTLLMAILAYVVSSPRDEEIAPPTARDNNNNNRETGAAEVAKVGKEEEEAEGADPQHPGGHYHRKHHAKQPVYQSVLNLILITAFSIGATATLLSQFYGILAFTMSAPDNGVFSGTRGTPFDVQSDNKHAPWIEGKALASYATCAWVFAAFAAGAAGAVWRLPRWEKRL